MRIGIMLLAMTTIEFGMLSPSWGDDLKGLRTAASKLFETRCAQCHQVGKLVRRQTAAGSGRAFGNILDLEALVRERDVVKPGDHDNSPLWKLMITDKMPYGCADEFNCLSKDEKKSVADWIDAEGKELAARAATRPFVLEREMLESMRDDLEKLRRDRAPTTRYLTLTHLYNAGASDGDLEVYRQGTVKLLNSLTFAPDAIKYEKLGPKDTILQFNLSDLGWTEAQWNRLLEADPFRVRPISPPDSNLFDQVSLLTRTKLAYLRADAFVFGAAQPPLYDELLNLPGDIGVLERELLHVDRQANIDSYKAQRSGFQDSKVSKNNRLIERHPMQWGAYWVSYDFQSNDGLRSLLEHPLGPGGEGGFQHDGGEFIFNLPNGMQAYRLADARGAKLDNDKGPQTIVLDPTRRDNAVLNAISCMGCHADGMRDDGRDDIRKLVSSRNFSHGVREIVEALHPEQKVFDALLAEDRQRFIDAERRAGLDPALRLGESKIEMVNAVFTLFERSLTKRAAAAELGLTEKELDEAAGQVGGQAHELLRRLANDQVPREAFNSQFVTLSEKLTNHQSLPVGQVVAAQPPASVAMTKQGPDFDLVLFSDKSTYKTGDEALLTVRAAKDCSLALFSVDLEHRAILIVPNKFAPEPPRLKAGVSRSFPENKNYGFSFDTPGQEKITAICSEKNTPLAGLTYDFSESDYLDLGTEDEFNERIGKAQQVASRSMGVKSKAAGKASALPIEARKSIVVTVAN